MATSPNFSWPEPDNSDLVKNGALAIRTAVDAIDSSMAELKGGTTGQVLSKTSNTDMDFTWVAQDDSNAIQNAIVDAKGDLIAATAADTPARLAVGADYAFLGALAAESTGLKWNKAYISYTPDISIFNGTVAPVIGNGTIDGSYLRIGNMVHYQINITFGSTSTYGNSSAWAFRLPFNTTNPAILGQAIILNSGVTWYYNFQAESRAQGSGNYVQLTGFDGSTISSVGINFPITFGTNDGIFISGVYEAV
jgi:hypothetical protein